MSSPGERAQRHAACVFGFVSALGAQTNFVTVPQDLDVREGNAVTTFVHPFAYAQARFQYTDGSLRGMQRTNIVQLELRRDGSTLGTFPARSANVALVLAEADGSQLTTNFAANYKSAPTTVFARRLLNVPDLSVPPPVPPAPWSIAIPFDAPWNYAGSFDFLWELQLDGNSSIGAPLALDSVQIVVPGLGSYVYNGLFSCTTAGGTFDIFGVEPQTSQSGGVTVSTYALRAPAAVPGVLAVGLSDPNLINVFCAPLRTSAEVLIPVTSDASGAIASAQNPLQLSFPFFGATSLYLQFALPDPSQIRVPIALSDGVRANVVEWVPAYKVSRLASTLSAAAPTGVRSAHHVLVARLSY